MNWFNSLMPGILNFLIPIIGTGIIALLGFAVKYVVERIRSVNNATIQMLAGVAVRYVETHFGPDTDTGAKKEAAAVDFLMTRIKGLDRAVATQFVQAAYQAVFTNIGPLAPGVAVSSTTPSASVLKSPTGTW